MNTWTLFDLETYQYDTAYTFILWALFILPTLDSPDHQTEQSKIFSKCTIHAITHLKAGKQLA